MSPKVTNVTRVSVLDNDVDAAAAENLSPGSIKRRRLDFGSEQQRYFPSAEPSRDTHGASISKNGRGSISRPEVEISEADNRDDWAERVHVKKKIDDEHNACDVCTLGGKLLCCAGRECKRRYHPSCLDPPFNTTPPGVWHCLDCVKKKIKSGVHSVSKGVESICDVREVVSDHEEMQKQKEYLVKYQGLAHFHNQWIPEMVLPLEAAKLVAKFNGRNQVKKWRNEWTVPERLIHKRLLPLEKCYNINSDYDYSWLVKWTGLGYDHATWELEGSSLLTSRQAMKLIKEYDSRHETAKGISSFSQANKDRKAEFSSLSEFSFGDSTRIEHCYLSYVNKLREYWHKGQNAIIIDDRVDKERVVKVIFFILSLQKVVRKPFLIVSNPHALSVWEAELLRVAPSTNFIVYKGGKDTRASIRSLELYNKFGQIMFQVLLCTTDIVFEDLEVLKCIQWEAIIVDECEESESTRYFKIFKILDAGMRLLVSSHIKDCSADYLVVLSLLDSGLDGLGSGKAEIQPTMSINKLKERLASYTAYECKSSVIRFVEYWVPVQLSNVQLEQYCATLLSNSRLLCSSLKTDPANTLLEVIISTRKCCDHPYLLDRSLRSMLKKGRTNEECLDAEIQVSGKLLFLEKMLLEIRSRNLRAMIIFQPIGGSGLDSAGDILEDFLCQKFGHNCYVRIDGNSGLYAHSKKQDALNTFNAKKSEKFVFLIENRACLSSIKLSLVDAVILFDSDLDPRNDLRALHRISITSRSEELRVFRLYSCCTIEEKALILAKEGAPIDNSIASLSRSVSHSLLRWGASHLFRKLDDLHECMTSVPGSTIFSDQSFLDDVLLEFSAELPLSSEANNPSSYSFISKVEQNVQGYKVHSLLAGEKEALAINGGKPGFLLWKKLLERKQCKWLFLSDSSSKIQRKVKCADNSLKESEFGYSEGRKKSQKVVNDRIDHLVLKSRLKHTRKPSTDKKDGYRRLNFPAARSATIDSVRVLESEVQSMLRSTQKSSLLLPKILHLSDVLKLSEDTKNIIGLFLEYLDKDYEYVWKTNSSLQAFQISVCWVAVSFLKQEIDHKESLAIAKLQLDFVCEEEEANHVYSELQDLEKGFICYLKNVELADLEVGEIMTRADEAKISERTACHQQHLEEGEAQLSSNNSRKSKSPPSDQARRDLQRCFESRCLSDQLTGLEEGERPMSSNCAMDSKSNTLRGKYLEEEVMSRCSNRGKRSKSSISVEQECEGELQNRSGNQILSAQLMASEEGVAPVGTSDAIAKYSKMASCDWQDLEEGEILLDSIGTNNSKNATPVLQDLEEGEIPIGSECHSISERLLNLEEGEIANSSHNAVTLEQELGSTTLDGSFKVKMDDSSCQIELHERNLKTSESAPNEVTFIDDTDDQQAPLDEVVFIGSDIMPTQNEPMTLQRASISDAAQDSWTVTPVDLESHSLECTVTHSSLVHQDMSAVQGESCPALQPPISTVPFTAKQRLPLEPLFFGGEGYQSEQMQSSSQETQIRRQLSLEDSTESCSPCTAHIPLQPMTSFHAGPNETFVQDARSRINVQDFRSAANHLRFPNDHLFDSPVRPEIPEHTSSDPLLVEMQRIANDGEKDDKAHEDMVLRLTSERDEEIRKVLQKYGPLIQDAEIARLRRKKEHTENLLKVYAHKFLAQVMTMNANGHMADLAQGKGKASVPSVVDQLIQLSAQQNAQMPVSGHEQYQPGPPMAPPAEVMSSRSSVCAPTIHARPCSSPMTCVARNLQNGTEQNEQMPALGREQYQANLLMAPPAEVMSSHSSVCVPTIHARPSPSTFVPRNLQNGSEQNAKMPALRREQYL